MYTVRYRGGGGVDISLSTQYKEYRGGGGDISLSSQYEECMIHQRQLEGVTTLSTHKTVLAEDWDLVEKEPHH